MRIILHTTISGPKTCSENGMIYDVDSRFELRFVGKKEKSPMEFIGPDIANVVAFVEKKNCYYRINLFFFTKFRFMFYVFQEKKFWMCFAIVRI